MIICYNFDIANIKTKANELTIVISDYLIENITKSNKTNKKEN